MKPVVQEFRFFMRFFNKSDVEIRSFLARMEKQFPQIIKTTLEKTEGANTYRAWLYFATNDDLLNVKNSSVQAAMFMSFQKP